MSQPGAAGWHGKLPTLGDFATRRLDANFVEVWDGWLAAGLQTLRSRHNWLAAYLASPTWRFLLMPGALPGELGRLAWAGVLMPSVDRVGRYYPLTLTQPLANLPVLTTEIDALWRWMVQLDDSAADAMHEDWPVERFEADLARIGAAPVASATAGAALPGGDTPLESLPLGAPSHVPTWLGQQAAALWQRQMRGRALWCAGGEHATPRLLSSRGLEPGRLVAELFGSVDNIG